MCSWPARTAASKPSAVKLEGGKTSSDALMRSGGSRGGSALGCARRTSTSSICDRLREYAACASSPFAMRAGTITCATCRTTSKAITGPPTANEKSQVSVLGGRWSALGSKWRMASQPR